jgi:hypothetical protein
MLISYPPAGKMMERWGKGAKAVATDERIANQGRYVLHSG